MHEIKLWIKFYEKMVRKYDQEKSKFLERRKNYKNASVKEKQVLRIYFFSSHLYTLDVVIRILSRPTRVAPFARKILFRTSLKSVTTFSAMQNASSKKSNMVDVKISLLIQ